MPENTGDINRRILRSLQPIRSSVIIGTQEEPLVLERAWENGKKEKVRIVNPERSSQIPTFVFWDHTITQEQQSVIHEAFTELFQAAHLDTKQLSFLGNWHDEVYTDTQGNLLPNKSVEWQIQSKWNPQRRQANGSDIATAMFFDPYQVESPHWEALFTNLDLFDSRTNFLIGAAQPDLALSFPSIGSETLQILDFEGKRKKQKYSMNLDTSLIFHPIEEEQQTSNNPSVDIVKTEGAP